MSYLNGINDYPKDYKNYGERILTEARNTLNEAGIRVFPEASDNNDNTDSVVIVNKAPQTETEVKPKEETKQKETKSKSDASWIRNAMPTSLDPMSSSSGVFSSSQNALSSAISSFQNKENTPSDNTSDSEIIDIIDDTDLFKLQESSTNIDELSNASDDEGEGNPLRTFFEKDIQKGFSTNSYAGTKYEKNIKENAFVENVILYSDNLYSNKKTSIMFGGTINKAYKSYEKDRTNVDYNAYTFVKHKASKFTYGLGGIANKNNSVNNININVGAMHNGTRIFAILKKHITVIPGLPTHSTTNVDVGIGKASGLLNPDEYNKKDKSLEEIDKIDSASEYIDEQRGKEYETDESSIGLDNTSVDLIISDTDEHKEYGIKGGYIFRHKSDKKDGHYSFVMPFGAISNINVNSKEGAKFVLGAHAGQNITFGNGWHIKTKALLEGSIGVLSGSRPNDYIIANAHMEANKNKFSSQLSLGTFFDNSKRFCRYAEAELNYAFSNHFNANIKAGITNYRFDSEDNNSKTFQLVAGVRYNF